MAAEDLIPRQRADRRQLQQIIAGLTEGVILVDPDQSIFWANEAALAMHGVEAIEELGATVSEYRKRFELRYRNNHRLSQGDYPMDRVLAGEAFSEVVVIVAPAGEAESRWVHRIRSLVLTDTAGDPDCLVLVIHDETERFSAEERFERTFAANPAPSVICRLSDLRYIKVNEGFLGMTGYGREEVLGRSVYDLDVLEDAEHKQLAVDRLNAGRTIPQMEACLRLPKGGSKSVIVAGQPIDIGEEPCMLLTFIDLEARKRAEAALRESEQRFSTAFRLAPVPVAMITLEELRIIEVNDAFVRLTGHAREDVVGRKPAELRLWESSADRKHFLRDLAENGSLANLEIGLRTRDGDPLNCLLAAATVTIREERCALVVMQDITERKRSEAGMIAAIETVMQDTSWFSRTLVEKLANLRQSGGSVRGQATLGDLTPRERDILGLMCQGLADKEIARTLGVSPHTVRNHVAAIYARIGVHRRGAAIIWARDRGFTGDEAAPATPMSAQPHLLVQRRQPH